MPVYKTYNYSFSSACDTKVFTFNDQTILGSLFVTHTQNGNCTRNLVWRLQEWNYCGESLHRTIMDGCLNLFSSYGISQEKRLPAWLEKAGGVRRLKLEGQAKLEGQEKLEGLTKLEGQANLEGVDKTRG